jgi:predicted enzyme related to lactoylglutathione lyase
VVEWRIPRPKSPIISPNPNSKLAISRTGHSTLIPRGKHRDRKTRDKPITRQSRKNKPENIPGQEEHLKKTRITFAEASSARVAYPRIPRIPSPSALQKWTRIFRASSTPESVMKIKLTSVFVNDQNKALDFYTKTLGFVKKTDISAGNYRWLTVVSAEDPSGSQLVLEPNANPAARTYQESILKQGIPATMLFVDDIQKEFQRLKRLGVKFTMEPTKTPGSTIARFDDTVGNLIQITQLS